MKKTRLIIILLGFAWPLDGVRKDCFVFEAQFGYGRVLSSSDLLSQWGRQLEMGHRQDAQTGLCSQLSNTAQSGN